MKKRIVLLLTTVVLALGGCSKTGPDIDPEGSELPNELQSAAPGLGNTHTMPIGEPFKLPAGIKIVGKIKGADSDCLEESKKNKMHRGSGFAVRVCVSFQNTSSKPITINLPAGMLFVAINTEDQNGLLIKIETFEVPPHDVLAATFYAYCANPNRSPSGMNSEYELGPVVDLPAFRELFDLLKDRKIFLEDYGGTGDMPDRVMEDITKVIDAVWEIAKTGKLPAQNRSVLATIKA